MKTALSIAGSDCSGGAGIQADLKTMTVNGVYAMSAVTALTAQNTVGVTEIVPAAPDFVAKQIDAVFTDIRPDAVKTGMIPSAALIRTVAERLRRYQAKNIVVDPVMAATSGPRLAEGDAAGALRRELFPLAALVTPNISEAEIFSGVTIHGRKDMEAAAKLIGDSCGCAVLLKGGHSDGGADDLLYEKGTCRWFAGRRIANPNTHGSGCTLASAVAANLAKGFGLAEAVGRSKDYLSGAISAMLDLGEGCGPVNHAFDLSDRYAEEKLSEKTVCGEEKTV